MARKRLTFDEITTTLTRDEADKLSVRHRLVFEMFNPNGAVAEKHAADKEIDDAVAEGAMKSGAIVAYGALATYHEDRLSKLLHVRSPRRFNVFYHAKQLREQAATAREKARAALIDHAAKRGIDANSAEQILSNLREAR